MSPTPQLPTGDVSHSAWKAAGFTLFVVALLALIMPATTLWDRDEPLYARTAVEMLQSGSYILPTLNGEVFAHKPPFIYWLMALSIRVFGVNEFAARFVSALGMAGTAVFTFMLGRRMFNPQVALRSVVILLTSIMSLYLGTAAMLDGVLLCFITMTIWAFVELLYSPARWPGLIPVFGIGLTLTLLTKGPVGPAVVGSMVLVTSWLARKQIALKWTHYAGLCLAGALSFTVFMAWAIPANKASGGEMARVGLVNHIIGRALQPMEGHGGSGLLGYLATFLIYLPVVLVGFAPWTMHLPAAFSVLAGGRAGGRIERVILWAWIGPTFALFSLIATKLPHYVFPLFPALALTTAAGLDAFQQGHSSDSDRAWFRRGIWLFAPVIFGLGLVLLAAPWILIPPGRAIVTLPAALALLVLGWVALRAQRRGQFEQVGRLFAFAFPLIVALTVWTTVPRLEPLVKISPAIAREVRTLADPETPIYLRGYTEPSLLFYLNRPVGSPVKRHFRTQDELEKEMVKTPRFVLVSTEKDFEWASHLQIDPPIREFARFEAINTNARGRRQVVVVSGRGVERLSK